MMSQAMTASKRGEIAAELAAKAKELCDHSDGHEEELCGLIRAALDDAFVAGQQHQRDMDSWWK